MKQKKGRQDYYKQKKYFKKSFQITTNHILTETVTEKGKVVKEKENA